MFMGLIGWIVLGLIAGIIASKLLNRPGNGLFADVLLGITGSVVFGGLFNMAGAGGVTRFNARSLIVAVVGAVFLVLLHSFRTPKPELPLSTRKTLT